MDTAKILKDTDAQRHNIPAFGSSDSLAESLLSGMPYERGLEEKSGIRFDAIEVTERDNEWCAIGFAFVGGYLADVDDTTVQRRVQGHYDLAGNTAWIQFLD